MQKIDIDNLNPIIKELLKLRGVVSKEDIFDFFFQDIYSLSNPFNIRDMNAFVDRLKEAIEYMKENNIEVPELEDKPCGCPGSMQRDMRNKMSASNNNIEMHSELRNWPIQLKLINPNAPYLDNIDLLISADCVPFTYANFHSKFLKGKVLMMLCPKLDSDIDSYIEKLANIFKTKNIKSITIVRMEVPCCGGVEMIVEAALKKANKNIIIKEYTISIDGEII